MLQNVLILFRINIIDTLYNKFYLLSMLHMVLPIDALHTFRAACYTT